MLNIGPGPDGEFDGNAYQRLKEIGSWMKVNSEAIYGTRMYKVFGEGDKIRFTQTKDGKTQYIFLFDFPEDKVKLANISFAKNVKLQLLGSKKKIDWKKTSDGVELQIPASQKTVTDYVWVIKVQ